MEKRSWLQAGPLSQWLYSALAEAGLPVIRVETRHMRAVSCSGRSTALVWALLLVHLQAGVEGGFLDGV
jgi:hypothetical protein